METPTPVSALLHAGILNAGPFLILRFAPVVDPAQGAAWILMVGGGFTAIFASVVLRTQPSVKVALGYSSAAHMGFMLFVCGLGVYPAAALHLVAHSFYKAHAFLSAGSAVEQAQAHRVVVSDRGWSARRVLLGMTIAVATYAGVAAASGLTPWEHSSLLIVGAIVVLGLTQLIGSGLDRKASASVYARIIGLAGAVTVAFFGLEELFRHLLLDSLPALSAPSNSSLVVAVTIATTWALAVGIQLSGWGRNSLLARHARVHLRNGLYANALFDRLVDAQRVFPSSSTREGTQS
jgi:NAD(P)H-quinone oxidoreductase subunit 5